MEINKIHFGDCLDLMPNIPDKSIDLILCDLPYGTTRNKWDIVIPFEPLWGQYMRIIKSAGKIILTAAQPFVTDVINSNRKLFKYDLIWYKSLGTGFLNAKRQPMRNHEHILVFYKKHGTYNPQMGKGIRKIGMRKNDRNGGCYNDFNKNRVEKYDDLGLRYPQSVFDFTNGDRTKENDHSTQKPLSLITNLILTYSNEGDLILDNCSGSGTLAVACHNTNRNFICIEKDETIFKKSLKRFENHTSQQKLFAPSQQEVTQRTIF